MKKEWTKSDNSTKCDIFPCKVVFDCGIDLIIFFHTEYCSPRPA